MATAKQPGIGQGKGGGRPARGEVVLVQARLSPKAAGLIQARAEAEGIPLWMVLERLALVHLGGDPAPGKLPRPALELAQEAAFFLACHDGSPAASRALKRAWRQTLVLASHELKAGSAE